MSQRGWVKPDFGGSSLPPPSSSRVLKQKKSHLNSDLIQSKSTVVEDGKLFVNQYRPEHTTELVVPKKKVTELQQWLSQCFSSNTHTTPLLLITGPPGSGKYQTLSLLCKELNIDLHTWEEQIRYESAVEWEYKQGNSSERYEERLTDLNPMNHLREFMTRTNRYSVLNIRGVHSTNSKRKKILLIKDFPAMVYTDIGNWHELLTEYCSRGKTPAVFILTQEKNNYGINMKLFPTQLQENLSMTTITFNGLANSFVTKALERVLMKEQKSLPSNTALEDIVESCNGDLRSALNTLQWILQGSREPVKKLFTKNPKKRKLASSGSKASSSPLTANTRDGCLDFMHALGKMLYAKRLVGVLPNAELPAHLHEEARAPLKEEGNLDLLVEQIGETSSKVLLYLHQNYPPFFNRIEDVAQGTHHLSSADLFSESFLYKEVIDKCALLTGVRGIMHSNQEVIGNSWRPLVKPDYYNVQLKRKDRQTEAQGLWPLQNEGQFFSERLPYLRHLMNHHTLSITPGQKRFLLQNSLTKLNCPPLHRSQSRGLAAPIPTEKAESTKLDQQEQDDEDIVIEDFDD